MALAEFAVLLWHNGRYVDEVGANQHAGDLHTLIANGHFEAVCIQPEAAAEVAAQEVHIALAQQQTCLFYPTAQFDNPDLIIDRGGFAETVRNWR